MTNMYMYIVGSKGCIDAHTCTYTCTCLLHKLTTDYTSLTQWPGVSGLAPLSSNSLTLSTWPVLTAHVRGVNPFCVDNVSIVQCTHTVHVWHTSTCTCTVYTIIVCIRYVHTYIYLYVHVHTHICTHRHTYITCIIMYIVHCTCTHTHTCTCMLCVC